jgi:heme a synthase
MTLLRRLSYAALGVAYLHLVFGAIVRISGSGMGCGDHWPKCHGYWVPPMARQDLIIEVTHRYLAAFLIVSLLLLLAAALRRRREAGVGGPGGVLRAAAGAVVIVVVTALFGAVTVKFGNPVWATVIHWTLAMALLATLAVAGMRAGALGGEAARRAATPGASERTRRGARMAAGLALLAVVLGGLTAKVPDAAVACPSFPLCGINPAAAAGASHVQLTHRVLAFLLLGQLAGFVVALRRRRESGVVERAALAALGAVVLQILVAGAMIGMRLPTPLRSLHEAVGVLVWLTSFVLAALAHRVEASDVRSPGSPRRAPDRPLAGARR